MTTGVSQSSASKHDDGLEAAAEPIPRVHSCSDLHAEGPLQRKKYVAHHSQSVSNVDKRKSSEKPNITIDLLTQFREHIKNDMEKLLTSQIQFVRDDINNKISSMDATIKDHERRLDIVPDLIDAKILEAKGPIDNLASEMSKNVADLDLKSKDLVQCPTFSHGL